MTITSKIYFGNFSSWSGLNFWDAVSIRQNFFPHSVDFYRTKLICSKDMERLIRWR